MIWVIESVRVRIFLESALVDNLSLLINQSQDGVLGDIIVVILIGIHLISLIVLLFLFFLLFLSCKVFNCFHYTH